MKNKNKIINQIEKIRSSNNNNLMYLMKSAFKYAPKEASKILKKINSADKKINFTINKIFKN